MTNERILMLDKHIASVWVEIEKAVKTKNSSDSQDALNRVMQLERLKAQQIALDESIAASTAKDQPDRFNQVYVGHNQNGHTNKNSSTLDYIQPRRKRPTVRPQEIRIGTFRKHISIANQIPISAANFLIEQGKALPTIPNFIHPTNSGFSQSASVKPLVNGSYIEVGDHQEVLIQKARRLLDICGFKAMKVEVLFEDGTTKSL